MLTQLSEWFWQEQLWFPEGLGWADLEDRDGRVYAKASDLWVALPIAIMFLIIRQIFERSVMFLRSHCGRPGVSTDTTQLILYLLTCLW